MQSKNGKFFRAIVLALVMAMSFMTACGGKSDSGSVSDSVSETYSESIGVSDSTSDSGSDGSSVQPPEYDYGEDWLDVYDAEYTAKLLAMGEQDFTRSQLSASYDQGKVEAHGEKTGGKYVGIFYFLWLGEGFGGIYDISDLLTEYDAADTVTNPLWANSDSPYYNADVSPQYAFHYFEEPLYGYYASTDKWVIKRHLELLSLAGIDFLYLDFTNAFVSGGKAYNIYPAQMYALMDCILEMQSLGYDVPQVVPVCCNNSTGGGTETITKTVEWVYDNYYALDNFKYKSCWFTADKVRNPSGNPLLVCYDFDASYLTNSAAANAFWIRNVVWPTAVTPESYANGFPWMDYDFPQKNYGGIMNVSVAQHLGGAWSSEAYLARTKKNTQYKYRGRGASPNQKYAYETDNVEAALLGTNFLSEWKNVLNYSGDDEVWMVTVTGWNEWVAQKFNFNGQYATFVDTFSVAFSRDIEMMRDGDGYGDTYFLHLAQNIREFKYGKSGKNSAAAMWQRRTIDYTDISAWDSVEAKYIDFTSDAMERNAKSVAGKYTYTDDSARNDIDYLKIANDSRYLYVLVAAKKDITAYSEGDKGWMNLWLNTGAKNGWNGYNYIINRSPSASKTSVERLGTDEEGNITAEPTAFEADYHVEGKYISYRIPLEALNVTSANELGVKASDNIFANQATAENDGVGVYSFGDIFAFYCGGDCAPMGRLNYAYRMAY